MSRTPERMAVPARALMLSALAFTVPIVDLVASGGGPGRFDAVVWLSTLVPAFILTHYRGWSSASVCLASAFFGLTSFQVYVIVAGQRLPGWPTMLAVVGAALVVSFLAGLFEEVAARQARSWGPDGTEWVALDSNG